MRNPLSQWTGVKIVLDGGKNLLGIHVSFTKTCQYSGAPSSNKNARHKFLGSGPA